MIRNNKMTKCVTLNIYFCESTEETLFRKYLKEGRIFKKKNDKSKYDLMLYVLFNNSLH